MTFKIGEPIQDSNPMPVTGPNGGAISVTLSGGSVSISSASLVESLWTDDSGAFYVRVDTGSAISWTTPSGATSAAPGSGQRPAGGVSMVTSVNQYQATATGTGVALNDYLSHFVTTDPSTGAVVGSFWINITQNAKLASAPSAANITPISPLQAGAALDASLQSILAAVLTNAPFTAPTAATPSDSTTFTPGTKGTGFNVTATGNIKLGFANGANITVAVAEPGWTQFPFAANQVFVTGSTATFTAYALN